jgi:CHAD domain-containing protein
MQKELEDLREAKYCVVTIGNFGYDYYYCTPHTRVQGNEELVKMVQEVLDKHFDKYNKIIEQHTRVQRELDTIKSDTYLDELRKTIQDQRYKIEKLEAQSIDVNKLRDELNFYRGKKK